MNELRLYTGTANLKLAQDIADAMKVGLGRMEITEFSDGEIGVKIEESVRAHDVFIIQPTCRPVNRNLMELLIMLDAFRRASAERITAVIPYYGYARQDKKVKPREPVSARLVANLIQTAGASRALCMDLHAGQIQGFFDIPVDHLTAIPEMGDWLRAQGLAGPDIVVVSPDVGGVARARSMAEALNAGLAIIAKRRPQPNEVEILEVVGDIRGRVCVMVDDIIDTGGSIVQGARKLIELGAAEVHACCTHGVLSGNALTLVQESCLKSLVVTDTIPLPEGQPRDKVHVVSVAAILADAIQRIHANESVSEMFGRERPRAA